MKKVRRINNEGFSLVELIIVIAIMAILAAALAPQLIKYIDNSRKSTDVSTGQSIATSVSVALTDEAAYNAAFANATTAGYAYWISDCTTSATEAFQKKVGEIISATPPTPKYRGTGTNPFNNFAIVIKKDASNNNLSFAIYPAYRVENYTGIEADMVYPTVGSHYAD